VGYLPENNPLYEEMEVSEYLDWAAEIRGFSGPEKANRVRRALEACGLGPMVGREIGVLSKGYRQRVGLAQAILHDPPILLLDEPTSGLDPNQAREVRQLLKELKSRKTFTVRYLRQHYDSIRMYIQWVKPYLRNIKRLHMDQRKMDTAYLVGPFEGSMVELEVLARHPIAENKMYACIALHFEYRTRPDMRFQQEGYQRGPIHVGRTQMTVRAYAWTPDDVRRYKEFRAKEDLDLLASIDDSLRSAVDALGGDLQTYIREAGGTIGEDWYGPKKKEDKKEKLPGLLDPFLAPIKGFGKGKKAPSPHCQNCATKISVKDLFCKGCGKKLRDPSKQEALALADAKQHAKSFIESHMYNFIKRYKASYGMVY